MRILLVAFVLLAACGGSSWDKAVASANKSDKPLVIEFYATWCGPCRWFEETVLTDNEVKSRLGEIEFERMDFDSSAGRHHARRLGVHSVPTLVAVDRQGKPIGLVTGALAKPGFLDFLRWTHEQHQVSAQ